jgi:small subunit ribosomal protein S29e
MEQFLTVRAHSVVTGSRKHAGLIRKYGLNMSRQAFREKAADIGFVKVCLYR